MRRKLAVAAGLAALVAVPAGLAIAGGGGGEPLAGSTRVQAIAAALRHTGGGTVTETEVGDGGAAYTVEVRLDDGREIEVGLDERFRVVRDEADDDREETTEAPDDEGGE